jgi:hypothetical protein
MVSCQHHIHRFNEKAQSIRPAATASRFRSGLLPGRFYCNSGGSNRLLQAAIAALMAGRPRIAAYACVCRAATPQLLDRQPGNLVYTP